MENDQESILDEEDFSSLLKKGFTKGKLNIQYQERLSRAFHFPYQKAYPIQLELMNAIVETIQNRKVSVFESPTGTGKTFSLLCGTGTWLMEQSKQSRERQQLSGEIYHAQDEYENEKKRTWENANTIPKVKNEFDFDVSNISFKYEQGEKRSHPFLENEEESRNKKMNLHWLENREGDCHDEIREQEANKEESIAFISLQDQDMHECDPDGYGARASHESFVPQIIFTTRTHSQIEQFIRELRTTFFGQWHESYESQDTTNGKGSNPKSIPLRTVSFASRKQLCINDDVQNIRKTQGMDSMNEECLEMRRNRSKLKHMENNKNTYDESDQMKSQFNVTKTCGFMPRTKKRDEEIDEATKDYIKAVHQRPRDIEELVELGESMNVCPYFGAREAAKDAQLITMTYDLLLNASTRKAIGISIRESIIIIDEAHNIIEKILRINSPVITSEKVRHAIFRIDQYVQKTKDVEKSHLSIKFKPLLKILQRFDHYCTNNISKEGKCMTPIEFMLNSGGIVDHFIVLEIEEWLSEGEVDFKDREAPAIMIVIEGDNEMEKKMKQLQSYKHLMRLALRSIQAFLLLLTDQGLEGRIHLPDPKPNKEKNGEKEEEEEEKVKVKEEAEEKKVKEEEEEEKKKKWSLKYQLLDPTEIFREIVDQARCVILAGGTMRPLSDFTHQLFPQLNPNRFTFFSCSHIVPKENLTFAITSKSASGAKLEYTYNNRSLPAVLYELMDMLIRLSEVIPHGIVVFLPSYEYLKDLKKFWNMEPDLRNRLEARKEVSFEEKESKEVNEILKKYTDAIDHFDRPFQEPKKKGGLLFAVMKAKLSEGINFKDNIGRAVIVVGMSYPHPEDPELVQRQKFIQRLHVRLAKENHLLPPLGTDPNSAGKELNTNSCMKSVNQSIGRVIRHQNDYAAIILLDSRYEWTKHQTRLPLWIRRSQYQHKNFGELISKLEAFFRPRD